MDGKIHQVLFTTIDNFINEGLKPATERKKKLNTKAKEYDNAISKLKNQKKSGKGDIRKEQELEQQVQEMKKEYDTNEKDTLELLRQANHKSEVLTILKIVEYWESCLNYFKDGVQYIESMRPKIEKYKKYARSSSSPTKKLSIFKQPLAVICEREGRRVPRIVVSACELILKEGKDVQGIFRISATKTSMESLKDTVEESNDFNFNGHSAIDVSGLLKLFLRELPDPLFTFERYRAFLDLTKIDDDEEQVVELKKIIDTLPLYNYKTIQHITKMCVLISECSDINKMTESNLSTVLTPNLLYTKTVDPLAMVMEMEQANNIYTAIIKNYNKIFETDDFELDALDLPKKKKLPLGVSAETDPPKLKRKKSLKHVGSLREKSSTRRGKKGNRIAIMELTESRARSSSFTDVGIMNERFFESPEKTEDNEDEEYNSPSKMTPLRKSKSKHLTLSDSAVKTSEISMGESTSPKSSKRKDSKKKKKKKISDAFKIVDEGVEDESDSSKLTEGNSEVSDSGVEPLKSEDHTLEEDSSKVILSNKEIEESPVSNLTTSEPSQEVVEDAIEEPSPEETKPLDETPSVQETPIVDEVPSEDGTASPPQEETHKDGTTVEDPFMDAIVLDDPVLTPIKTVSEEVMDTQDVDTLKPQHLAHKDLDLSFTPPPSPMMNTLTSTSFLANFVNSQEESDSNEKTLPISIPNPVKEVDPLLTPAKFPELAHSLGQFICSIYKCQETGDVQIVDQSLREMASYTKLLLSGSKDYVRHFDEMKDEITSSSLRIQQSIRNVIVAVKTLHKDPSSSELIKPLLHWTTEFDFCISDFWESSIFSLKLQLDTHLGHSIQKTASHVSQILRAALSKTLEEESTANMEMRMKWDIHEVIRLSLLRAGLFDQPQSWKNILETLEELKFSIEGFIVNSIGASTEEDSDELSSTVRTQTKNIVKSFRLIENIIKEDFTEVEWDFGELKEQSLSSVVSLLRLVFQDDHSTLESKLLILSVGPYTRRLAKEITKWIEGSLSGLEAVDSILSIKNQVYEIMSLINYHRLDGISSEYVESLLLTKLSTMHVMTVQLSLYGTLYALKEDPKVLQRILLSQNMIMSLIESSIFH